MIWSNAQQNQLSTAKFDFTDYCNDNFKSIGDDSLFVNFYISNHTDTVYFRNASCIIQGQPSRPIVYKRRIKNSWAEGELQIFQKNDSNYNWTYGSYKNGVLTQGSFYKYYNNGDFQLTGQYAFGYPHGIWTLYHQNGRIERIVTYELGHPIKEIEFDNKGNIIEQYDLIKKLTKANKT
jgi:hypothetical protein